MIIDTSALIAILENEPEFAKNQWSDWTSSDTFTSLNKTCLP